MDGDEESLPPPLEWKFSQVFGERSAGEEVQEGMRFYFSTLISFLISFIPSDHEILGFCLLSVFIVLVVCVGGF